MGDTDREPMTNIEMDNTIYGGDNSNRFIVENIDINTIWADVAQPRRIIPGFLRQEWDGNPAAVNDLLGEWLEAVHDVIDFDFDIVRIVMSREVHDDYPDSPIVNGLVDLGRLAATIIRSNGLIHPITIKPANGNYRLVAGERRWLAHHILIKWAHDKFRQIPARINRKSDVWVQAAENGGQRKLNAIEMARQLALLIMDMYSTRQHEFFNYTAMVYGECDRAFYAQVADGHKFPILPGYLHNVLAATGLSSRRMVSAYRALLSIDDNVWMEADEENWTEGRIRLEMDGIKQADDDDDDLDLSWITVVYDDNPPTPPGESEDETGLMLPIGNMTDDRKPVIDTDVLDDIGTNVYIPENHDDAQPFVNEIKPELGRLLTALSNYYRDSGISEDSAIGWYLDDLLDSYGSIQEEIKSSRDALNNYCNDMKLIKKYMRSFMEQIAKEIDNFADELMMEADIYHKEIWPDED